MHPFYGPSSQLVAEPGTRLAGLVTMAAYLAFWAGVAVIARRELDRRFPVGPAGRVADPAADVARLRYARGEIDRDAFLQMSADLARGDADR